MTTAAASPVPSSAGGRAPARTALLIAGFALAVGIRVAVGGANVAHDARAGVVFAAILTGLAVLAAPSAAASRRAVAAGAAVGVALCLPRAAVALTAGWSHRAVGGYPEWALVVAVVAADEEAFLRGALYEAARGVRGDAAAVAVGALAFAALHVPLAGWHVVPLDLAVGVALGGLRAVTGGWASSAIAHMTADLLAYWLP